ncbi:hypothetical protein [Halarcobacter sp.]|uniref:hypothetical protein n=1 Tax=Halarcobacter sp. TaxID=2321133 RepID=UPI0029F46FE8|nr:hypothetical protein [Halarcobacter sp.]
MRFNNNIQQLKRLKPLNRLETNPRGRKSEYINQVELLNYSSSLCLFCARLLRNEISIPNKEFNLSLVGNEIIKLNKLFSEDDYYSYSEYTKKNTKEFFKKVGLKPKHIKN